MHPEREKIHVLVYSKTLGIRITLERMLRFTTQNICDPQLIGVLFKMFTSFSKTLLAALFLALLGSLSAAGQSVGSLPYKSQDVADDGIPVLIKHLPQWETVRHQATLVSSIPDLISVIGERQILNSVDFPGGTEAVTAPYDAGKLVLIEFSTPQASIDADGAIKSKLAGINDALTVYRRIGNYNAFVFDGTNPTAANALLDQIKYEKSVQWLGENPYIISAERAFVIQTADLFVSTVLVIVMGIGFSILCGVLIGSFFFYFREQKRANSPTFSDAGGMTRLNLDGFTPDIVPERLLKD